MFHRVSYILNLYQEQPNILDGILEDFVTPLIHFVKLWVRKCVAEQKFELATDVRTVF